MYRHVCQNRLLYCLFENAIAEFQFGILFWNFSPLLPPNVYSPLFSLPFARLLIFCMIRDGGCLHASS
jgi:hypothetical protein